MKKILITGIIVFLAMFAVTCEAGLPDEDGVKYTDVLYSEDGSQVTLYLDGIGVPLTRAQREAQRAMSTRLSKMAYDFLEVIFISGSKTARAQWELGQPAGISGVPRGTAPGIDYKWVAAPGSKANDIALMAVGKKDGKTLLGIGQIGTVDGKPPTGTDPATGLPSPISATIGPDTKSVTFYIESVKTGLLVGAEQVVPSGGTADSTTNIYGIQYDSLKFVSTNVGTTTIKAASSRTTLGNADYPLYSLPDADLTSPTNVVTATQDATYTFYGAALTYVNEIKLNRTAVPAVDVEPRIPRYMDGGRYWTPKTNLDLKSTIELIYSGTKAIAPSAGAITTNYGTAYSNVVPLRFGRQGTGIISFYIDIPVYILSNSSATNEDGLSNVVWHIRTGLGSELYSLDDGLTNGGCALIGYGVKSLDWLDIEWEWVN